MLDSFIYSVNVILPIFILVVLGIFLHKIGIVQDGFTGSADKLVFKVALPAMLFIEVSGSEFSTALNPKLVLYTFASITCGFALVTLVTYICVKDNAKRGALIQGICRSNFAILGVPLVQNMFGDDGVKEVSLVLPLTVLLFNTYSVIVLSVFAPKEHKLTSKQILLRIGNNILTNPLIIAVVLGLPFMLWKIPLITVASKTLTYLKGLVTPVALISLGASFRLKDLKGRIKLAVGAALCKTALMPVIMVGMAIVLGFRGAALGIILILFGTPTAVSSYIMAKNMGSDGELAGQILLLTTLLCLATVFLFIFILKTLALI